MSSSPRDQPEEGAEKQSVDELDDQQPAADGDAGQLQYSKSHLAPFHCQTKQCLSMFIITNTPCCFFL